MTSGTEAEGSDVGVCRSSLLFEHEGTGTRKWERLSIVDFSYLKPGVGRDTAFTIGEMVQARV